MSRKDIQIICHYNGAFDGNSSTFQYTGGEMKLLRISRDCTYSMLIEKVFRATKWDPQCTLLEIRYKRSSKWLLSIYDGYSLLEMLDFIEDANEPIHLYLAKQIQAIRNVLPTISSGAGTFYRDMGGEGIKYYGPVILLNYLEDPDIGVIKHSGYRGGFGRWSIAKQAAEMAMESHLFDILIWLKLSKEEQGPGNLQKKIAELLGIEFSSVKNGLEDNESEDIAMAIHDKLKNKRFLLVLGDVSDFIDLTLVGVPTTLKTGRRMRTASVSKVVYVTTLEGKDFNIQFDREFSFELFYVDFRNVVREEAVEAAHSLKRSTGSYLTTDTVLDFLMYLLFISSRFEEADKHYVRKWLLRYSRAQGFVSNSTPIAGDREGRGGMNEDKTTEEEMNLSERMMEPLFKELYERSFIDENYQLPSDLRTTLQEFDKYWIGKYSLKEKSADQINDFVGIAISITEWHNYIPPSPRWSNITALFITCEKEFDIPPTFFNNMQCLRVLELHFTSITSLPSSLSSLSNLILLWLRFCQKLTTLPTSLQCLERLEFLELSECTSLQTMPEQTFEKMSNLRHLDLSKSNIMSLPCSVSSLTSLQLLVLASCNSLVEIPEKSFENMQRLEILDLSNSSSLKSLPSSLSNLVHLKQLHLKSCSSLKIGLGVLKNLSSLEVLDLSYCCALEDIQDLSIGGLVPNIKSLDLSGLTIPKRFSFRGCQRLLNMKLDDNENLEVLNLSGATQLKYLSITHPLNRLEILPINYSDTQDILFQGLNWSTQNDVGAVVWVTEPNIFKYVSKQVFDAKCFSQFHIRVSSSIEEKPNVPMLMGGIESNHFRSIYRQINSYFQTHRFSYFKRTYDRHLEIYKCKASLRNLLGILRQAELLTLFDNSSVDFISYDNQLCCLKECRIGRCQNVKCFCLRAHDDENRKATFESLEVIWVSDLPQLTDLDMYNYSIFNPKTLFALLKHVHLEGCPKLVTVFNSSLELNNLETLEIKFCSRLKFVVIDSVYGKDPLQRLKSLCLWELPKLERICKGYIPKLQKMRVRGCRKLTNLPLRVGASNDASTGGSMVELEGESDWWNHLEWDNHEVNATKHSVHFRPWRLLPFTLRTRR